jgi:hypothetical protein
VYSGSVGSVRKLTKPYLTFGGINFWRNKILMLKVQPGDF